VASERSERHVLVRWRPCALNAPRMARGWRDTNGCTRLCRVGRFVNTAWFVNRIRRSCCRKHVRTATGSCVRSFQNVILKYCSVTCTKNTFVLQYDAHAEGFKVSGCNWLVGLGLSAGTVTLQDPVAGRARGWKDAILPTRGRGEQNHPQWKFPCIAFSCRPRSVDELGFSNSFHPSGARVVPEGSRAGGS
jgi:hypothetical protein